MRGLFAASALAGLAACAAHGPLDEAERSRIRVVAPAPARFPPKVEFKVPPDKAKGAAKGAAAGIAGAAYWSLICGPFYGACFAVFAPAGAVAMAAFGAAVTPSNEVPQTMVERARSHLGAPDVQQLLMQRFSERVIRLTSHTIDPSASKHGPQSTTDVPSYSGVAAGEGTLVAELAVQSVSATVDATEALRIGLDARMRLVRPSDGATLLTRYYAVARHGRFLKEYEDDGARLLQAIAGAVDEVATLMVDDAFLLRSGPASDTTAPAVAPLEPLPSGACVAAGDDCRAFRRVPRLDTSSPKFRWTAFPEPAHLEAAPWLRTARNVVYDLWIIGGDDDRLVEGITSTEHTLERPLSHCRRYSWAVRARFETEAGTRSVRWNTGDGSPGSSGSPFIIACPGEADAARPGSGKP